jgi:myo-inositol-1-phosphate synthase
MEEVVEEEIENALNLVVITAEQSSKIGKALKEKIFETVSTLRQLFVKIRISGDLKLSEINNLTKKVSELETEQQSFREKQAEAQQTISVVDTNQQSKPRENLHSPTCIGLTQVPAEAREQRVALRTDHMRRQYASVVKEAKPKRYKMTVRSRGIHQP